jgi:dihydrofolate synthase/folylpolyglutamate synthase
MRFATLADWLAWQETLHPQAIDLGLARVASVLEGLALPDTSVLTISVGGTNGKGSCVAMLDRIFRESGYRVGTYTSPHILRYNERICINGRPVSDDRIVASFQRIDDARGDTSLSFFEFGTLTALDIFSGQNLDVRILEVGLGGRLDAVNIIDPDIALIASIGIDHQEWLGNTRDVIGIEKAGIFRSGRPAVIGDPDLPESVLRLAQNLKTPLYRQGFEFSYDVGVDGWHWRDQHASLDALPIPAIPGEHQLMNAAAVLEVLQIASRHYPVTEAAIRRGLAEVTLPGRFQLFAGPIPVLLDVAHNPQAVSKLAGHLHRHYRNCRIHAVFAVMRDKDIAGIIATICDAIDCWYLAPLQMTRAATPEQLLPILTEAGVAAVRVGFSDVAATVAAARVTAHDGDLILVFGSFFLVSDYLAQVA